jgi:hypothetical protein
MFSTPATWRNDPVVKAAEGVHLNLSPPTQKINGIPLTDQQYDDYARLAGRFAHAKMEQTIGYPNWSAVPDDTKRKVLENDIKSARKAAQQQIMIQSRGTDNDIMAKSWEAKRARYEQLAPFRSQQYATPPQ